LGAILLFLAVPWLQQEFNLIKVKPLDGFYGKATWAPFDINDWLDGKFQAGTEKYFNENFGLRNTCVRVNNQVSFNLFQLTGAANVVVGKNNYLYGDGYLTGYYGKDFIGEKKIDENIRKLKVVREALKKKNIDLIVVFVPGKARFFPEFLPEEPKQNTTITNYEYYSKVLTGSGVPFLNLIPYFQRLKSTTPYPLFPKTGIHWTRYGADLALDTMIHFIENVKHYPLPHLNFSNYQVQDSCQGSDDDIEKGMNLLYPIPKYKMTVADVQVDTAHAIRPRMLTLGDSYFWNIYGSGLAIQVFTEPKFWYYYTDLYLPCQCPPKKKEEVDLQQEIEKQDVIILFANDSKTVDFGGGFIDDAYDLYANNGAGVKERMKAKEDYIKRKIAEIRANPEWMEGLKKQASDRNVTLESFILVTANAQYEIERAKK